jgi:hypothetical protein
VATSKVSTAEATGAHEAETIEPDVREPGTFARLSRTNRRLVGMDDSELFAELDTAVERVADFAAALNDNVDPEGMDELFGVVDEVCSRFAPQVYLSQRLLQVMANESPELLDSALEQARQGAADRVPAREAARQLRAVSS